MNNIKNIAKNEKIIDEIIYFLKTPEISFFGEFLLSLNYENDDNFVDTMAVTVKNNLLYLYYNNEFIESLSNEELRFILMHEVMHLLLNHIHRHEITNFPHLISNIAQDMIINEYIKNEIEKFKRKNIVIPDGALKLPKEYKGNLIFEELAEWLIKQNEDFNNKNGNGDSDSDGKGGNKKSKNTSSNNNEKNLLEKAFSDNYTSSKFDEHLLDNSEHSKVIAETIINDIKLSIENRGNTSEFFKKIISITGKTQYNVFKEFKKSVEHATAKNSIKNNKTYMKLNRRLPGISKGKRKSSISYNVILDTSGSMLTKYKNKTLIDRSFDYLLNMNGEIFLTLIDTTIKKQIKLTSKNQIKNISTEGFGGTEIQPAINKLAEDSKNLIKPLIVITDGYCDTLNFNKFNDVIVLSLDTEVKIKNKSKRIFKNLVKNKE